MPGDVRWVRHKPRWWRLGQRLGGQAVLVTEAMKMESEIQAPIAGTVTGIFVAKGDSVNPNEVLIEIEPADGG